MKQKTIATRHLRTKIAAGYVLILFVIFGIVYIWLNEQNRQQELEATTYKIRSLRKDVHEVYMKVVDLSMIGETVLDWNEEDMAAYHEKRLEVDSLLSRFKSRTCRSLSSATYTTESVSVQSATAFCVILSSRGYAIRRARSRQWHI